jgi:hypothetical protein
VGCRGHRDPRVAHGRRQIAVPEDVLEDRQSAAPDRARAGESIRAGRPAPDRRSVLVGRRPQLRETGMPRRICAPRPDSPFSAAPWIAALAALCVQAGIAAAASCPSSTVFLQSYHVADPVLIASLVFDTTFVDVWSAHVTFDRTRGAMALSANSDGLMRAEVRVVERFDVVGAPTGTPVSVLHRLRNRAGGGRSAWRGGREIPRDRPSRRGPRDLLWGCRRDACASSHLGHVEEPLPLRRVRLLHDHQPVRHAAGDRRVRARADRAGAVLSPLDQRGCVTALRCVALGCESVGLALDSAGAHGRRGDGFHR